MNQQYMYYINGDDKDTAKSLVKKMSTRSGPGTIILLSTKEMNLVKDMAVIPIGPPAPELTCPHGIVMNEPCAKCGRFRTAS